MHRIRQWYWVCMTHNLCHHYWNIILNMFFRNWLKSLWLQLSAQGDYTRLRFGKNAYAKSDGNKLYILNRFRSGMRCEENQMIKDSRLSRCLNMSHDVSKCLTMLWNVWRCRGVLHLSKAKGNDAYSKMLLYGTKLLFIFPNNIYQQVKLVFVCCHFQLLLTQTLFRWNYNLHSEKLSTVTLIKIQFFYFSCFIKQNLN